MQHHSIKIITLLLGAAMLFAACGKEDNLEQPQPSTPQQQWPTKKISRIVHSIGSFDYMTFDFTWENNLLKDIHCIYYDGSSLGGTILKYDSSNRLQEIFPYDGAGRTYEAGAMHYHYDANGRLSRQTFILPLQADDNLCQTTYDNAVPCELVYTYSDDNKVSEVQANKTMDDGRLESSTYHFVWVGTNVTTITCGNKPIMSNMQYDDKPNPMAFPMGIETMGTDMIMEGVWGNAFIFLGNAFSWSANNMTTLIAGNGQCSFTYDEEGYVLTKTITAGGQNSVYTFTYCN